MNTIDWHALDHKMGLVQQWVFQPMGAALIGVVLAGSMIKSLPDWQGPAFAVLAAASITMVFRLIVDQEVTVSATR